GTIPKASFSWAEHEEHNAACSRWPRASSLDNIPAATWTHISGWGHSWFLVAPPPLSNGFGSAIILYCLSCKNDKTGVIPSRFRRLCCLNPNTVHLSFP